MSGEYRDLPDQRPGAVIEAHRLIGLLNAQLSACALLGVDLQVVILPRIRRGPLGFKNAPAIGLQTVYEE